MVNAIKETIRVIHAAAKQVRKVNKFLAENDMHSLSHKESRKLLWLLAKYQLLNDYQYCASVNEKLHAKLIRSELMDFFYSHGLVVNF